MNYDSDNKIWRVGGPLFAYFGIRLLAETLMYVVLGYIYLKEFNLSAAFNGITYIEGYGDSVKECYLLVSGVAMVVTIPVMYYLMKKDYEYPLNPRNRERVFIPRRYIKGIKVKSVILPLTAGVFAALGPGRIISSLPLDGILGDYGSVKDTYEAGSFFAQIVVLGVLSPVTEEFIFRGLAFKRLKGYYDVTIAAYISSLMFAVSHFNLIQGIYAFIMGIMFVFIYEKNGSIVHAIAMHVAANITTVVMWSNPVTKIIDSHWYIRLPVAVAETVLFVVYYIKCVKCEKEKNDEIT